MQSNPDARRLDLSHIAPAALEVMAAFHSDVVQEVKNAVDKEAIVVVGMAQNPVVKKARKALDAAGLPYKYLEYGSYLSEWRRRLAIKLWSGWPTFPQVFVKGELLGGADQVERALADGSLKAKLDLPRN